VRSLARVQVRGCSVGSGRGCPPGVRRNAVYQGAFERGQEEKYKGDGLLGNDQGVTGDAAGEVALTERLIVKKNAQAIGQLGYTREREHG
jgi:hypothetical protein